MATPYQEIAKAALMNWNGLSEAEADHKIATESVSELEGQVYAMDSVKSAVIGLATSIGLTTEEAAAFAGAVIGGPEDAEIFEVVSRKAMGLTEEQKLDILAEIHDGWVVSNSSQKTFDKKVSREQLRQYAPLELIGWNEVRSDLLFLTPVLNSVGVSVNEEQLEAAYHERVAGYMEEKGIKSPEDLQGLVSQGQYYYDAISPELHEKLAPYSATVTEQIISNWQAKDPKSAEIYQARQNGTGQNNK